MTQSIATINHEFNQQFRQLYQIYTELESGTEKLNTLSPVDRPKAEVDAAILSIRGFIEAFNKFMQKYKTYVGQIQFDEATVSSFNRTALCNLIMNEFCTITRNLNHELNVLKSLEQILSSK